MVDSASGDVTGLSARLLDQRLRNRAMDALEILAEADQAVRSIGHVEYFEQFFDVIDDRHSWRWQQWSTLTPDECARLEAVSTVVVEADAATPGNMTDDDFIRSGWPTRIARVARTALALMGERGRFDEDHERADPGAG